MLSLDTIRLIYVISNAAVVANNLSSLVMPIMYFFKQISDLSYITHTICCVQHSLLD